MLSEESILAAKPGTNDSSYKSKHLLAMTKSRSVRMLITQTGGYNVV